MQLPMSILSQVLFTSFIVGASAHGFLIKPMARQQGASNLALAGTKCNYCSCCWFENSVSIPGEPTICDPDLITSGVKAPCSGGGSDSTKTRPWRAPGTAPISSACGMKDAQDGATLPPAERLIWKQGSIVEVAMAISANHGGGYNYRLCPSNAQPTEECFQANTLPFATDFTTVHFVNGSRLSIPAKRTTQGTSPAGSQWTKNPIPGKVGQFPSPFYGAVGNRWEFSLVDQVTLPADLIPGDYVLSWRWDCETTPQVWTNCGDVTVIEEDPAPSPSTLAPPTPAPTSVPPSCKMEAQIDACMQEGGVFECQGCASGMIGDQCCVCRSGSATTNTQTTTATITTVTTKTNSTTTQKCKPWCASNSKDWATKCAWNGCSGCSPCPTRRLQGTDDFVV